MERPVQSPAPSQHLLRHRGDRLTFSLRLPQAHDGAAYLRTNLGQAAARRREVIDHVEHGSPILERDWHDLSMEAKGDGLFELTLPLLETGRFQAKSFFLPAEGDPIWPAGDNVVLKVEPAHYLSAATVYCAFVRTFGENQTDGAEAPADADAVRHLEEAGYEVLPRSGTFRDLIQQLDHITGSLGFRVIQLLPIFPTPTTHARMGRFGSPFAALDLMGVDPALAEFDRRTTPLQQFRELVDETHRRQARLFLDIPINHTGWASWLQNHHPEWFKREASGDAFESPGAWGVTWGDLAELDYTHRELWRYMADVFLFWCRQGVDGFRCDAGYMIPIPVWEYITAKVRQEFPDTLFLLEGLGGDKKVVFDLLDRANLNWAYSELFQNFTRPEVENILEESITVSRAQGVQIHFAETHDNNRLAATSQTHARMRTALAALCSHGGAFGITCGVEWFAETKIEVHRAHGLNWGSRPNQIDDLRKLTALLETHPAFRADAQLDIVSHASDQVLLLHRFTEAADESLLVVVNLDPEDASSVDWPHTNINWEASVVWDLLSGESMNTPQRLDLAPGEARCFSPSKQWLEPLESRDLATDEPPANLQQRLRAKVLQIREWLVARKAPLKELGDLERASQVLAEDPTFLCRHLGDREDAPPRWVTWHAPRDAQRIVPWPEDTLLRIVSPNAFIAELSQGSEVLRSEPSFPSGGNADEHSLFLLPPESDRQGTWNLRLTQFASQGCEHANGEVLFLPNHLPSVALEVDKETLESSEAYALCTNGRGAMAHVRGAWGDLRSQYDTLLAANPHPDYPVDRRMLLARVRAWIVYRDYSRAIDLDCLKSFAQEEDVTLRWRFNVPTGMGHHLHLGVRLRLVSGSNRTEIAFNRIEAGSDPVALSDGESVRLILRPDIEDRGFHEKSKAMWGPEEAWPKAIQPGEDHFAFAAEHGELRVSSDSGGYVHEPEWHYMVSHPIDANRGLDGSSDLFSPGYFSIDLLGKSSTLFSAELRPQASRETPTPSNASAEDPDWSQAIPSIDLKEAARRAIAPFIVKRDDTKTVIAGYPWFLDWGRDTLICLRGIIAAGLLDEARDIIRQFARFEKNGTLPNMIRGDDDSNRDTSDAPLWLFVACADLVAKDGNAAFLDSDCGTGRSVTEVLESIAYGYLKGTPNGIQVDSESGLVFSPSHFTWMDTNHPAGTPRVGYPIEIQALWYAALTVLQDLNTNIDAAALRQQVAESIITRYWNKERGFLSDCLHAQAGQSASQAEADDHLRPNQLFALTLGAMDGQDPTVAKAVLTACEELLVPGGIRSLADRRVWHRLPVKRDGQLLNDPSHPYWGRYEGDEDTRRKPAYHNGTVWTWPFPSYPEALVKTHGPNAAPMARAILSSSAQVFHHGCLGHIPEILDGNAPHTERGCGAQAWSVTELYRVLDLVETL